MASLIGIEKKLFEEEENLKLDDVKLREIELHEYASKKNKKLDDARMAEAAKVRRK